MRLSDTREGEEWLSQFTDSDKPIARRLLDDLTIVTSENFKIQMRDLVDSAIGDYKGAVALYPIWEVARPFVRGPDVVSLGESIFPLDAPCNPPIREPTVDSLAANDQKPILTSTIPGPRKGIDGSVGIMMQLITEITRQQSRFLNRPACHVLRATKCHKILLLDDIMGSGRRALDYLEAFYRVVTPFCIDMV